VMEVEASDEPCTIRWMEWRSVAVNLLATLRMPWALSRSSSLWNLCCSTCAD
jgi:hypothetical protein